MLIAEGNAYEQRKTSCSPTVSESSGAAATAGAQPESSIWTSPTGLAFGSPSLVTVYVYVVVKGATPLAGSAVLVSVMCGRGGAVPVTVHGTAGALTGR